MHVCTLYSTVLHTLDSGEECGVSVARYRGPK